MANSLDKIIIVTGAAGFIGSHLVDHLLVTYPNYTIIGIDKLTYCSSLTNLHEKSLSRTGTNVRFIKLDITNAKDLSDLFSRYREIDCVFHLAAYTHVDRSFGASIEFTQNNVLGTHILLEEIRSLCASGRLVLHRFVHVSTDEVYGSMSNDDPECEEDSILAPTNPYAATKAAAECLVKAYYKSFKLPVIITRSNNVYGPRQYPEKIIPKFICRLKEGLACCVHGNGLQSRNYLYVTDVVEAMDIVFQRGHIGQTYNIGSNFEITNLNLAKQIIEMFSLPTDEYLQFVEDRAYNDQRYAINSSRLKDLGWQQRIPFEEGLELTRKWFCENDYSKWWSFSSDSKDVDFNAKSILLPHPNHHT